MPHEFGADAQLDARWLAFVDPQIVSPAVRRAVLAMAPSPDSLLGWNEEAWQRCSACPLDREQMLSALSRSVRTFVPVVSAPVSVMTLADPAYPGWLKSCDDAPAALFFSGDLAVLCEPCVAIVGSRSPSVDATTLSLHFAETLAACGVTIVSGLARGIDASAHRGALRGGKTVAVLPTGLDRIYPPEHRGLADQIAQHGLLVSEFMPGSKPLRQHFPRRNRTLSGLSQSVLVIEAGLPSGTLITANAAADQNREVWVLPWSLTHRNAAGNRQLLADGANLALAPADLVAELRLSMAQATPAEASADDRDREGGPVAIADEHAHLLRLMGDGIVDVDALARLGGWSVSEVRGWLTELELSGRVSRQGYSYCRSHP